MTRAGRLSASSSGETIFYDAEDPGSRVSFATAAEDFVEDQNVQAFSNRAFEPDDDGRRRRRPRKRRKQQRQPPMETNVDSATQASADNDEEDDDSDDFGFRFMPAIPPPRPLASPNATAGEADGTLTLRDALEMKLARTAGQQQRQRQLGAGMLLETNIDQEIDDNSSIPSSYRPRRAAAAATSSGTPVATFTFNTAVPPASDVSETSTATAVEQSAVLSSPPNCRASSTLVASPASQAATIVENGRWGRATPTPLARFDTDLEADTDAFEWTLAALPASPQQPTTTTTTMQQQPPLPPPRRLSQTHEMSRSADLTSALGHYVLARPPPSAMSVPEYLNSVDDLDDSSGGGGGGGGGNPHSRSLDTCTRMPPLRPRREQKAAMYTVYSVSSQQSGRQAQDSGDAIVPGKADGGGGGCCSRRWSRASKIRLALALGGVACCCLLTAAVAVIAFSVARSSA